MFFFVFAAKIASSFTVFVLVVFVVVVFIVKPGIESSQIQFVNLFIVVVVYWQCHIEYWIVRKTKLHGLHDK